MNKKYLALFSFFLIAVLLEDSSDAITVKWQEGGTDVNFTEVVNDTWIYKDDPDTNCDKASDCGISSTDGKAYFGRNGCASGCEDKISRYMIHYNLSQIPSNANITYVSFNITEWGYACSWCEGCGDDVKWVVPELYRILRSWDETSPTWNTWSEQSGNYSATRTTYLNMYYDCESANFYNYTNFTGSEFADLIQAYVNGTYTNYGWLLKVETEGPTTTNGNKTSNYGSEYATASMRPSLTVSYTVPAQPTEIKLYLNGTENNKSYDVGGTANFTAKINVTSLTIKMMTNYTGWTEQSGVTSIINETYLNVLGNFYNITAWYPGGESYLASSVTYFFNVTVPVVPPAVAPVEYGIIIKFIEDIFNIKVR